MKKHGLLLVLLALSIANVKSQDKPKSSIFFEKVYVRTDRQIYAAGENLWYSAFLVNAQDNRLLNTSNTLYVELVSKEKTNEVKKEIIPLSEGKGHGDFELEETLKPGTYILRAWTNWMRNFGDNFIFEKEIIVVAEAEKKESDEKTNTASDSKKGKTIAATQNQETTLEFLPEGGSLINDVASVVAFKTIGNHKSAVPIKGNITNSKGEIITVLDNEKGIGTFLLKPLSGETYYAKGRLGNGKVFSQQLPAALAKGYAIHVTDKDSIYQVIISTNSATDALGKDVLLAGKSHGINCFKTQFTLQNLQQVVSVYKNNFPEGIASMSLYDSEGRPNCERMIYVESKIKPQLSIITDKGSYQTDENITIHLKVNDEFNQPLRGSFSVAALDNALAKTEQNNLASYLLLTSELKGDIENPQQYFDIKNANRKNQLDLLMLTQGWRDFLWKKIADTTVNISQIPETGITLSGSVKRKVGDKPIEGSNVTVRSKSESQSQLFAGVTDANGKFYIDGFKFTGEQKFSLNAVNKKTANEGWIKLDPLFKSTSLTLNKQKIEEDTLLQNAGNDVAERYELMKSRNALSSTIMLNEIKIKDKSQITIGNTVLNNLGYKDEEFDILPQDSDYNNLSHYLLANSKQAMSDTSTTSGNNYVLFHNGNQIVYPRFIINNKEMFFMNDFDDPENDLDTEVRNNIYDTYYNLSMSEIEHVTIKHRVGINMRDYFLVYLTLKEGAMLGTKGNPIIVKTSGYYEAREFTRNISPDEKRMDENITLYWNPLIETDEHGEASFSFRSPGTKTQVRLAIQGITSKGNPMVKEQIIPVK